MTESQQVRGRQAGAADAGERQGRGDGGAERAPAGPDEQVARQHAAHGQSIASWTCVGLIMLGALVMAIAVIITTVWLFVAGAVVVVLGAISGKVLSAMGFGVSGRPGH
jgi:hypothetical protein